MPKISQLSSIIQQPIIDDLIAHGHCEIRRGLSARGMESARDPRQPTFEGRKMNLSTRLISTRLHDQQISAKNKVLQTSENGRCFFQIIQHITAFLSMHHSSPFRAETVSGRTLALQVKHFRIFKPRHNRFDDHEIFINRILRFVFFWRQSPHRLVKRLKELPLRISGKPIDGDKKGG